MRIGTSIILINGYCYQSYNWKMMRPLGQLQNIINFLEEYQCDEIAIIRPIRDIDDIESFKKDINEISKLNCMTPISFGGGLRSIKYIDMIKNLPIERLIFSSPFINKDLKLINYAIDLYGHQSIQCILPFKYIENSIYIFSSIDNSYIPFSTIDMQFIEKYANEIILLDTNNEGKNNKFSNEILDKLGIDNSKVIISGGIGNDDIKIAKQHNIASVLVDNKILHKEYSIRGYRNA
jgi:imidazole glycerol phosphate synthase subunit HisF